MSEQKTIYNLKDEILKVAPEKKHAWTDSSNNDYGKADDTHWGHVKVKSSIQESDNSDDCASVSAIKAYVGNSLSTRINDDDINGELAEYYTFTSYGDDEGANEYATGKVKIIGNEINGFIPIKVVENSVDSFINKIFYIKANACPNNESLNQLYENKEASIYVDIEDIDGESYSFTFYDDENKTTEYGTDTVKIIGQSENGFIPIQVITNSVDDFADKVFYIEDTAITNTDALYQLYQVVPVEIYVKMSKVKTADDTLFFSKKKISLELNNIKESIKNINFDNQVRVLNNAINHAQDMLDEKINNLHTFDEPTQATTPINELKTPGYYYYDENKPQLTYSTENDITCGLVTVKKLNNSIIQYIESYGRTELDGNVYQRTYINENWQPLQVVHRNIEKNNSGFPLIINGNENRNDGEIYIKENTAGYIITWIQKGDKSFIVNQDLYEYETIFTFDEKLMIDDDDVYIFGNLIGKMDVKITNDKIEVRSTLSPQNKIKNVHETFFIPRCR